MFCIQVFNCLKGTSPLIQMRVYSPLFDQTVQNIKMIYALQRAHSIMSTGCSNTSNNNLPFYTNLTTCPKSWRVQQFLFLIQTSHKNYKQFNEFLEKIFWEKIDSILKERKSQIEIYFYLTLNNFWKNSNLNNFLTEFMISRDFYCFENTKNDLRIENKIKI